jgi:hypothetical protein
MGQEWDERERVGSGVRREIKEKKTVGWDRGKELLICREHILSQLL